MIGAILVATALAGSDDTAGRDMFAGADDGSIVIVGREWNDTGDPGASISGHQSHEYRRISQRFCGTLDSVAVTAPCVDGAPSGLVVRTCDDGSLALDPLFRRPIDASGAATGPWEPTSDVGGCPEDPAVAITVSAEDFRRLPLAASIPAIQPADGQTLLGVPLVLHTDATPQELTTTVLGTTVRVRATPTSYTWEPGDGSTPITTTDPGAPYPQQTVTHTYTRPGEHALTLRTTWSGQFQVPGGSWLPITGTATTVSPTLTITVHEARSVLVADPLP